MAIVKFRQRNAQFGTSGFEEVIDDRARPRGGCRPRPRSGEGREGRADCARTLVPGEDGSRTRARGRASSPRRSRLRARDVGHSADARCEGNSLAKVVCRVIYGHAFGIITAVITSHTCHA